MLNSKSWRVERRLPLSLLRLPFHSLRLVCLLSSAFLYQSPNGSNIALACPKDLAVPREPCLLQLSWIHPNEVLRELGQGYSLSSIFLNIRLSLFQRFPTWQAEIESETFQTSRRITLKAHSEVCSLSSLREAKCETVAPTRQLDRSLWLWNSQMP